MTQRPPARTRTYVCPVCNEVVAEPTADPKKKNVLLCRAGHRVQERASSFAGSLIAGLMAGALLYSVSYYLPGLTRYLLTFALAFRWTTAIWSLWLIAKGIYYATRPQPTRGLGLENAGLGTGFLIGLLFAGLTLLSTQVNMRTQPFSRTMAQVAVNIRR